MSSPEPTRPTTGPPEPRRLSDSPLFWFFVFGAMGLLALIVVAPKHALRQERLERMADSRERPFTEHAADPSATGDLPQAEAPPQAEQSDGRAEQRPVDVPVDAEPSQEVTAEQHEPPHPSKLPLSRSLLPLMIFLAAVLAIAAAAVGVARYLRLAEDRADARNSAQKRGQVQ